MLSRALFWNDPPLCWIHRVHATPDGTAIIERTDGYRGFEKPIWLDSAPRRRKKATTVYDQPIKFRGQWNSRSHLKTFVDFKAFYSDEAREKTEQTGECRTKKKRTLLITENKGSAMRIRYNSYGWRTLCSIDSNRIRFHCITAKFVILHVGWDFGFLNRVWWTSPYQYWTQQQYRRNNKPRRHRRKKFGARELKRSRPKIEKIMEYMMLSVRSRKSVPSVPLMIILA